MVVSTEGYEVGLSGERREKRGEVYVAVGDMKSDDALGVCAMKIELEGFTGEKVCRNRIAVEGIEGEKAMAGDSVLGESASRVADDDLPWGV